MYHVLRGVTASACDYWYGLILSRINFLGLKRDYARIAQWENITLDIISNCLLIL